MTIQEAQAVKNSWHVFQAIDPELIGDVFYSKLFLIEPRLQHLFSGARSNQARKLVEMLNVIVGRLDRIKELQEDIRNLAIRHVKYGVQPAHYEAVGTALFWTLQQGLGVDWTEEVKEAWASCYGLLAQTMIKAAGYPPRNT